MRSQMSQFNEGDIFTRAGLLRNLGNLNRLASEIYPVLLTDVIFRLNEADKTVDMAVCFRPKRR